MLALTVLAFIWMAYEDDDPKVLGPFWHFMREIGIVPFFVWMLLGGWFVTLSMQLLRLPLGLLPPALLVLFWAMLGALLARRRKR